MSKAVDTPGEMPKGPVPQRIGELPRFDMPDDWTMSGSWKRAQEATDHGGPINKAERMVSLDDTDGFHRVVWALSGGSLRAECECKGYQYNDWCAHLASLWWRWVRGEIHVTHLETGKTYRTPPSWLRFDCEDRDEDDLDGLTPSELDAYLTCEWGDVGVREYARNTGRSPGTLSNLLRWAREKVGGDGR
ncbi:SWIM zinc finger family protein [Haloarcula japonica]|uniref:SWIM zinc finger family protein n=1 Tax=Haloarcula japonica TaxID=29282 RepID=UPI0039F64B4D